MALVARRLWRSDFLRQALIVAGGVEVYELSRRLIKPNWPDALANAHRIMHVEQGLHFAWEQSIQQDFLDMPQLVRAMNIFYFVGHFLLTAVFFFWLYFRSREGFRSIRNALLLATGVSLVIHWGFPTAPPRLAGVGLEDTLDKLSDIDIGSPTSSSYSNPVAAVPSLHAGWAIAVGYGLIRYGRTLLYWALGLAYPLAVMLTIVVTGNHFILDAVAGIAVMVAAFGVGARLWPSPRRAAILELRRGVEQSGSSPGS